MSRSIISIIAAVAENGAIGKNQKLLWYLPADLKRFKKLTTGHVVIMGRKTFESLPNGPLPARKNVVLSSFPEDFVNCFACDSMSDALDLCGQESEVFIIGGAQVYHQALRFADKIYLTRVHATFENADTFFPIVNWEEWNEVEHQDFPADEKNPIPYSFITYVRRK